MWDFPDAPVLDDVFTPLPGVNYLWNGVAWVYAPTASAPVIELLIPQYMLAGGNDGAMRVNGLGFVASSVIYLDNVASASTVFVSTEEVRCTMLASAATPGTVQVTVQNGATVSNAMPFQYVAIPTLTLMTPNSISVSGAPLSVTLTGTGFVNGSIGYLNYNTLPTVYVSPTELTVTVQPDMGTPGDSLFMWVQTGPVIRSNNLLFGFTA